MANASQRRAGGAYDPRPLAAYLNCKVAILLASNIVYQGVPSGRTVMPNGSLFLTTLPSVMTIVLYTHRGTPTDGPALETRRTGLGGGAVFRRVALCFRRRSSPRGVGEEDAMRFLYIVTKGMSDPTLASVPLHLAANGSVELGQEVTVVLAGDATELAIGDNALHVEGLGVPPARELLAKLRDHQVPVYV